MTRKVLFVDDEPNVLQSIKRSLRKKYDVDTAQGGEEALQKMTENGDYAIVVSDMRMPGMSGVEFLSTAKVKWPDTVRMMLTGNADQQTAVDAVNHGDVFRFLNKPCEAQALASAIDLGLRQHELITAERDLLEHTVRGSIKALAEVLSLTNPDVFGQTARYKKQISTLAMAMGIEATWQLESAALLSQIGCVTLPADLVKRRLHGQSLSSEETGQFAAHAEVGAQLLEAIPRLEEVAEAVRYQEKNFDGGGYPRDAVKGEKIPLGSRMLRIVADYDAFEAAVRDPNEALERLHQHANRYDPEVLKAFEKLVAGAAEMKTATVSIKALTDAMILAEDVFTNDNVLLIAKGHETTLSARRHMQSHMENGNLGETVTVWVPAT